MLFINSDFRLYLYIHKILLNYFAFIASGFLGGRWVNPCAFFFYWHVDLFNPFGMFYFARVSSSRVGIFQVPFLSLISSDLSLQITLLNETDILDSIFLAYSCIFYFLSIFACYCNFFTCHSCLIFLPDLVFCSNSLRAQRYNHRYI